MEVTNSNVTNMYIAGISGVGIKKMEQCFSSFFLVFIWKLILKEKKNLKTHESGGHNSQVRMLLTFGQDEWGGD